MICTGSITQLNESRYNQLMLYGKKIALCSEILTKQANTFHQENRVVFER